MINFSVMGDLHNEWGMYKKLLDENSFDFSLCVGDNSFYENLNYLPYIDPTGLKKGENFTAIKDIPVFNTPIITVPGNHEDQEYLDDGYQNGIFKISRNITVLHAAILKIMPGIFIAGLGKIFAASTFNDYDQKTLFNYGVRRNRILSKEKIKRRNHLTKDEISTFLRRIELFNKTRKETDRVIWLSHDAPRHTDPRRGIPVGSDIISDLMSLVDPDLAFFGHYHHSYMFNSKEQIVEKQKLLRCVI